jgi:steroid delta-isomerase-like uncharacterized protein
LSVTAELPYRNNQQLPIPVARPRYSPQAKQQTDVWPGKVLDMDTGIERQRVVVAEHILCENEHDWPAVFDTFVQDDRACYDVVPLGRRFGGIEGVRGFYEAIAAGLPDLHIQVESEYDVPGCSIREVIVTGTHEGQFAGVKPLGNQICIKMAAFYTFDPESGKIASTRIYYDQASLIAQMQGKQAAAVA